MQPGQHPVDLIGIALQERLDRAVGRVAYPARHAHHVRVPHCREAKAHALHFARDADGKGFEVMGGSEGFHEKECLKARHLQV